MKMIDYLDRDRDRILAGLKGAHSPAEAQQVLEKETDRLLLQYNEDCTSVRVRDAAAGMMQAVRSSVPFLDSAGEPRVWRREGYGGYGGVAGAGGNFGSSGSYGTAGGSGGYENHRKAGGSGAKGGGFGRSLSGILLVVGAVITLAGFAVPALSAGGTAAAGALLKSILLPVAGGGCLYLAGRTAGSGARIGIGKTSGAGAGAERIEITIDPEKLWSSLRGAVMVVDRNLELAQEEESYARRKAADTAGAEGGIGLSADEIELFSGLLEMADADSPQMAADIRYYLHKKDVEAVDWSPQYAAWFERLPALPGTAVTGGFPGPKGSAGGISEKTGSAGGSAGSFKSADEEVVTIRPALVQHGRLLKKGTAAG